MKKYRLLLIVILITGAVGVGYLTASRQEQMREQPEPVMGEMVDETPERLGIVIDSGEEKIEEEFEYSEGETAFSLLEKVASEKGIEMETEQYDFGVFVKAINGLESGEERAWIYFVNGESGAVAADQYEVSAGDKIEWKYIEPEY